MNEQKNLVISNEILSSNKNEKLLLKTQKD